RRVGAEGHDPAEHESSDGAGERSGTEAHRVLPADRGHGRACRGHADARRLSPSRTPIAETGSHISLLAGKLVWHGAPHHVTTREENLWPPGPNASPARSASSRCSIPPSACSPTRSDRGHGRACRGHADARRLSPSRTPIAETGSHISLLAGKLVWHGAPHHVTTREENLWPPGPNASPARSASSRCSIPPSACSPTWDTDRPPWT